MKKILIPTLMLFSCLLQAITAQAQIVVIDTDAIINQDSIDQKRIKVQYEMTYLKDTISEDAKPVKETLILEIGKHISKCYSYNAYVRDSVLLADIQAGASQETINEHLNGMGNANISYQIFKHYPAGKVTTLDRLATTNFLCEEEEERPEWELLPDTATILSYHCQKATCRFKGRTYTAWYTMEIPVSDGPWKLFGLPGLIVQAEDTRKHYRFRCTGVEQCETSEPMLIHLKGREKISRKNLNKMYERMAKDPIGFMASAAPNVKVNVTDEHGNPIKSFSMPYNPIELAE
ncbi:GLPGLI family protein [uncultured Bacteroides sp.]|uniref:GLPGLI family protein n=1 Tax=uncultured Bacteroides sp. TaxID=162156 RepID=UPI00262E3D88|nr:GLPGLI family protein [uncultured Bacteroides sp.]